MSENLTKRPVAAGAEKWMEVPIPVLDHGFVRLVDYMGDDHAVAQAARNSYGKGTRSVSDDRALIRTLMRDWHTSCFEMCEIKVAMKLPIFVARQIVRHRTACLAGDVKVTFDLPGGVLRRGNQAYTLTVKEIFDRFQPSKNQIPAQQRNPFFKRDRVQGMLVRSCDEDTIFPIHNNIVDIWECGEKPVMRVEFSHGGVLRATKDHLCFTDLGWLPLGEALKSKARFYAPVKNTGFISEPVDFSVEEIRAEKWKVVEGFSGAYEVSNLGRVRSWTGVGKKPQRLAEPVLKAPTISPQGYQVVSLSKKGKSRAFLVHRLVLAAFQEDFEKKQHTRHMNHNRQDNRIHNLKHGTPKDNSQDRLRDGNDQRLTMGLVDVVDFVNDGVEMTYDIEVSGPYHNFVGGGVIVHNSLNEYSARYSVMENEFYIPAPEHLASQSVDNKQGRAGLLTGAEAARVLEILKNDAAQCYGHYEEMLSTDGQDGLTRELARMNLPVNVYTQWYWKTDLHNLLNFLRLRIDLHAQFEVRVYADALIQILTDWCPVVWDAFKEYRLDAMQLSATEVRTLLAALNGDADAAAAAFTSKRERAAFLAKLDRIRQAG